MSKIVINASSPNVSEKATLALLEGGFVANSASIQYNLRKGASFDEDFHKYPLILEGRLAGCPTIIYVNSLSAGFGNTGSHALVKILNTAGFSFDEKNILTGRLLNHSTGMIEFKIAKTPDV